jgi:hypothetical protein
MTKRKASKKMNVFEARERIVDELGDPRDD